MASGTLGIMLDRRNRWEQCITLELFNGVKDIFRNHLPVEATRKQNFKLSPGAITPVSLYEFELRPKISAQKFSNTDYGSIKNR